MHARRFLLPIASMLVLLPPSFAGGGTGQGLLPFPAYVDDDAPGDPGPGDPAVSDPVEDGTAAHPFDSVREAIDYLLSPCSLVIMPGTYHEDFYTPSFGCMIQGSGKTVTRIRSVSGELMIAFLDSDTPSPPPIISVSDLTLESGSFTVFGNRAPGTNGVMEVTLQNVAVLGVDLVIHFGGFGLPDEDRMVATLRHVDLANSSISTESQGGRVDLLVDSATMQGGSIRLQASGVHSDADLRDLIAPSTSITMPRSSGGHPSVTLRDSTIAALDTRSPDYPASATIQNVRFTGAGVLTDQGEGSLTVSISDSTFESGGVTANSRPDIDTGSGTEIRITRSLFLGGGVDLSVDMEAGQYHGVYATLDVDSTTFLGEGVSARVEHAPWGASVGGTFELLLRNSVFDSVPAGLVVDYEVPDPGPGSARAEIRATIVNNTFFGCDNALRVRTTPHVPGNDTIDTLIQNNIVAGGGTGIEILGTDDHTLTVVSNDVHGNTVADYSGDLPDQTGLNGNISEDPRLVDPPAGDLGLTASSPCIDAGTAGPEVPPADHAGTLRPLDGDGDGTAAPDIGAFEFVRQDADGDGWLPPEDCDDTRAGVNPGTFELPGNTLDENCDGIVTCDPGADWRRHGRFVSCVARAAGELLDAGLITSAEAEALVRQAAQSRVGLKDGAKRRTAHAPTEP